MILILIFLLNMNNLFTARWRIWKGILPFTFHSTKTWKDFWSTLTAIQPSGGISPWLLKGDFNTMLVLFNRVKLWCSAFSWNQIDFNATEDNMSLTEIKCMRHFYTWHKGSTVARTSGLWSWELSLSGFLSSCGYRLFESKRRFVQGSNSLWDRSCFSWRY